MLLSVRITTGFVFTIFWGWLEQPSSLEPIVNRLGDLERGLRSGGQACCTRCSCWGDDTLLLGEALAASPRSAQITDSELLPINLLSTSRSDTTKTTNDPTPSAHIFWT